MDTLLESPSCSASENTWSEQKGREIHVKAGDGALEQEQKYEGKRVAGAHE